MKILSHRGYWQKTSEKNSQIAFERSFSHSFGTETDIRDRCGQLVISHDMPDESAMSVDSFFSLYKSFQCDLPLALNIKADGLQTPLQNLLLHYEILNSFVFDMAVPDLKIYLDAGCWKLQKVKFSLHFYCCLVRSDSGLGRRRAQPRRTGPCP